MSRRPHTELRIFETMMGPTFFIFGPEHGQAYVKQALPVFLLWPFDRTASRLDAERHLERLQILEDRSLIAETL